MKTALPSTGREGLGVAHVKYSQQDTQRTNLASTAGMHRAHSLSTSRVAPSHATTEGMALIWNAKNFFTAPPIMMDITPM